MSFSNEFFRSLVETAGQTQKELAASLQLSEGSIVNYKRDRTPKAEELYRIARYFGVSMERFFGEGANAAASPLDSTWRSRAVAAEQKLGAVKGALQTLLKKI